MKSTYGGLSRYAIKSDAVGIKQPAARQISSRSDFIRPRRIYSIEDGFSCEASLCEASQGFAETLEVDYLALAEELNNVVEVGVIGQAENIVVCDSCLLLGGQILGQVGNGVAL